MKTFRDTIYLSAVKMSVEIVYRKLKIDDLIPKQEIKERMSFWEKKGIKGRRVSELIARHFIQRLDSMNWHELANFVIGKCLVKPKIKDKLEKICSEAEFQSRKEIVNFIIKASFGVKDG